MTEAQSVVLELLKEFSQTCEKLGYEWFMINGSALGAVKYGGFIPWDDDIDVGLMRPDYELFLKHAQDMLPNNIFLQNYRTDKHFPHTYSKLRNSDTAFIEKGVAHLDMNHGMYIDIFPLDFYPEDVKTQRLIKRKKRVALWKIFCAINDKSRPKVAIRNSFFRLLGYHKRTAKCIEKLESLFMRYNTTSRFICNYSDRMRGKEVMTADIYGKGTKSSFEGLEVTIPEMYDEYLTFKYGDWRSDPPADRQLSHHEAVICDSNKSYKEYRF